MSHAPRIPPAGKRPALTHFIGLSLVTPASRPQLQASLDAFRAAVKKDKELLIPEHVVDQAIRPVDTLHLTICTLSLPAKEPESLQEVIAHLRELDLRKLWQEAYSSNLESQKAPNSENALLNESIKVESTQPQEQSSPEQTPSTKKDEVRKYEPGSLPPLRVTLKGVGKLGNASKTTVVYAPPDDPTRSLQRFCESIREDFKLYLPKDPVPRDPDLEAAKEGPFPAPVKRPTLESFPHPDSYKSDISVPATPAPQPPTENVPLSSLSKPVSPPPSSEHNVSNREQKRRAKEEKGKLKELILHATLLNTIYARKVKTKNRRPITIDARPLLERFKDMVWMEDVKIERLCLFRMGAKEMLDEEGEGTGVVRYVAEAERELDF